MKSILSRTHYSLLLVCTLLLGSVQLPAFAQAPVAVSPAIGVTYSCRVHKVWDGDTFDATCKTIGEVRVRLHQVDAPERNQPRGSEALRWLNTTVWKQTVNVKVISVEGATAKHQSRIVGRTTFNRLLVNRHLVENGWAWAAPGFTKPNDAIRTAEKRARASKLGLWQDEQPIAPWNWRHGRRNTK